MPRAIQLSLFDEPTLNVARPVKEALNDDVRASGLSREQIVDRMNLLAERYGVNLARGNNRRLTIEIFEKWLNPNDLKRQIPLKALPVFCAAVGQCSAMDVLTRPMGLRVIGDRDQKLLAWAKAKMVVKEQGRRIRRIESEL